MSKNINKKNEEKLKIYLSKVNDTKRSTEKDRIVMPGTQNDKVVQKRTAN